MTERSPGTWLREEAGYFEVGASTRSGGVFLIIPFTLLWSGVSLRGSYGLLFETGLEARDPFAWVVALLCLPFLLGTGFLISQCLMMVAGEVSIRVANGHGVIFTGVRGIGWRRRFRIGEAIAVRFGQAQWGSDYQPTRQIFIVTPCKALKFGSGLNEARQDFILETLRSKLGKGVTKPDRPDTGLAA